MIVFESNGQTEYPVQFVVMLIQKYIFVCTRRQINIKLNLDNEKEKELFEKAANRVLDLYENGEL